MYDLETSGLLQDDSAPPPSIGHQGSLNNLISVKIM